MSERRGSQSGFSIVEMIIAIFLLGVLALAVLPLLIGAVRLSTANTSLVSATAFANGQLAAIRAAFPSDPRAPTSCAALADSGATGIADGAAPWLEADVLIGQCPGEASEYPTAVRVTVVVREESRPDDTLVSLPTEVLVSGP